MDEKKRFDLNGDSPTWVIGDIHGEARLLEQLLKRLQDEVAPGATLVFLGDYIDRGPDSRAVLDILLNLRSKHSGQVVFLKGNHEQWMLHCLEDPRDYRWVLAMDGLTTVESYSRSAAQALQHSLARHRADLFPRRWDSSFEGLDFGPFLKSIPDDHLRFLQELELTYEDTHVVCSHAGLNPERPLEEQGEAEFLWSVPSLVAFHWKGAKTLCMGHEPTFRVEPELSGHPLQTRNAVLLDTGAHWTGVLTAMGFPGRALIQTERR